MPPLGWAMGAICGCADTGQGHLVSVGSLKNTHPYLLLPSRKSIPGDFPAYLEVKETFQ